MIDGVTVVITTYNAMPFLPESVESILAQTFTRFELLIVDDGSTDESRAYLETLSDSRIRVIRFPENRGRCAALNVAVEEASHDWIAMQDADDRALPNRLQEEIEFLNRSPEYSLVSCAWGYIGANGRRLKAAHFPRLHDAPTYQPMIDGAISNTGSLFSREAALAVGGYRDVVAEDLDLWLRLDEASYRLASIPKILTLYRSLSGGITSDRFIQQRMSWAYSYACSRARRSGVAEPSLEEFTRDNWPKGWKRLEWEAQRQFRFAGVSWGDGRKVAAAGRLLASFVLNPRYVFTKFRLYFFDRGRA